MVSLFDQSRDVLQTIVPQPITRITSTGDSWPGSVANMRFLFGSASLLLVLPSGNRATTINDLPNEILSNVFTFLNAMDYVNFVEATSIREPYFDERRLFLEGLQKGMNIDEPTSMDESLISLFKMMVESYSSEGSDESFLSDLLQRIFSLSRARYSSYVRKIVNEGSARINNMAIYIKKLCQTPDGETIFRLAYGGNHKDDLLVRSAINGNLSLLKLLGTSSFYETHFEKVSDALIPLHGTNELSDFLVEICKSSAKLTHKLTLLLVEKNNLEAIIKYVDFNSIETHSANEIGSLVVKGKISEKILEYILEIFGFILTTEIILESAVVSEHYKGIQEKIMNGIFSDISTLFTRIKTILQIYISQTKNPEPFYRLMLHSSKKELFVRFILADQSLKYTILPVLKEIALIGDLELLEKVCSEPASRPFILKLIDFMINHGIKVDPLLLLYLEPLEKISFQNNLRKMLETNNFSSLKKSSLNSHYSKLEYILRVYINFTRGPAYAYILSYQLKSVAFNLTNEFITLSEADCLISLVLSTEPSIQDFKKAASMDKSVIKMLSNSEIMKSPSMNLYFNAISDRIQG